MGEMSEPDGWSRWERIHGAGFAHSVIPGLGLRMPEYINSAPFFTCEPMNGTMGKATIV